MKKTHTIFLTRTQEPTHDGYYCLRLKGFDAKPIFPAPVVMRGGVAFAVIAGERIPATHYDFFGELPKFEEASRP